MPSCVSMRRGPCRGWSAVARDRDVGGVPPFRVCVETRPVSGASGLVGDPEARDWRLSLGVRRLGCGRCSLNAGRTGHREILLSHRDGGSTETGQVQSPPRRKETKVASARGPRRAPQESSQVSNSSWYFGGADDFLDYLKG